MLESLPEKPLGYWVLFAGLLAVGVVVFAAGVLSGDALTFVVCTGLVVYGWHAVDVDKLWVRIRGI